LWNEGSLRTRNYQTISSAKPFAPGFSAPIFWAR
jgi:hypothetical protein